MAENLPASPRQLSPSPDPDISPNEPSWRADDSILAHWRAHTFSHEEWLAALDAERPDVIDELVDARERDDAYLVRELGARLVWGWVSAGRAGCVEEEGVFLSFDDEILDKNNVPESLIPQMSCYLKDVVSERRMNALKNGATWTERERVLAHKKALEDHFEHACDPNRYFEIVRVESRAGTPMFVAHIIDGCDYPCESFFAGAADSIDEAMEAVKALGYVSADDVRKRYHVVKNAFSRIAPRAVSFEMIEKEAVAMIEAGECSSALPPTSQSSGLWVYKVDAKRGALFESAEVAVKCHTIQCALGDARTWGEFRRLLPAGEWAVFEECLADGEDNDSSPSEDDLAQFDGALVDEVMGSDYGTWPDDGNNWLPITILVEHSKHIGFGRWFIDGSQADAVAEALRGAGHQVDRADFLLG